mgnify:CR=1 FL=1
MAELTEDAIIVKLATIDAQIDNITSVLGTSGQSGVQFTDYTIGSKRVDGSTRLEQLLKAREHYQKLLATVPKSITRDHGHYVEPLTGVDRTQYEGDQ